MRLRTLALVAAATVACGPAVYDQGRNLASDEERACTADDECVIVDVSCGCAPNGKVAVHEDHAELAATRGPNIGLCDGVDAIEDNCFSTSAICADGLCSLAR